MQLYEHISMQEEWIGRLLAGTTPDLPVSDDLPSEKVLAAPPAKTTSNETFVQGVDSGEWVSDLRAAAALALEKLVALDLMTQVVEASNVNDALLDLQSEVAAVRRSAVRTMRASGLKLREIAEGTWLTHQRVAQMERGADRKEKA